MCALETRMVAVQEVVQGEKGGELVTYDTLESLRNLVEERQVGSHLTVQD